MPSLKVDTARGFFPALGKEWVYMDNAGGTQTVVQVADRIRDYLLNTNVQLGASYDISQQSGARVEEAQARFARFINAAQPTEVVFGSSTTMLLQSLGRALGQTFVPGDEIIVTNVDHEANIGPWLRMQQAGIKVKSWNLNPDTYRFELAALEKLMSSRTKLVAFTHTSNILGTINPVKEITRFVHERGVMVCVDGVAYAPHRLVDVQELDVDFYVFSLYKVYGPHYAMLYGKQEHLDAMPGINHFFIKESPYKIQPGNVNYELSYGSLGILDYLDSLYDGLGGNASADFKARMGVVFDAVAAHEQELAEMLLTYLRSKDNVKIIGERNHDQAVRVPTISFVVRGRKSSDITLLVDKARIGIRYGDFYARRLIDSLGYSEIDGVVRVSMVHYNTLEEVESLVNALESIL